jgi:hypothetical protein
LLLHGLERGLHASQAIDQGWLARDRGKLVFDSEANGLVIVSPVSRASRLTAASVASSLT